MKPVRVRVGSRVLVLARDIGEEVCAELRALFEHKNPEHEKKKRLGIRFDHRKEPKIIRTWTEDGDWLSLPRGGMKRARSLLVERGFTLRVKDERTEGYAPICKGFDWPVYRRKLFEDQEEVLEALLERETCYVRSPTGCLTGDAIVTINRAGKGAKMNLSHVVGAFNGGRVRGSRGWDASIPTFVRAPFSDGAVHLARVIGARESGVQEVYSVHLEPWQRGAAGRGRMQYAASVTATADHRFLTPFGWRALEDLSAGDDVLVDAGMGGAVRKAKPWYRLRALREHPYAGRKGVKPDKGGWTVPLHRLVAEARENGLELEDFVERVKRGETEGLCFLDPKVWVVHHKDEDPRNNTQENLEVMTHAEHRKRHRGASLANISSRLVAAKIVSVEYAGEKPTYDLEVDRAAAFIANGVAVHNSGKTSTCLAAIVRLKLPTIIIVWTGALLDQWVERITDDKELGVKREDIGIVFEGKKTIGAFTVAMQQSLARMKPDDPFFRFFGVVVADELQRFSAPTFIASIDPFPARYRWGVSADERRSDRKEFLAHDLFSDLALEVKRADLVAAGRVRDVEVRLVPTGWELPEEALLGTPSDQHREMLNAMSVDGERDKTIIELVRDELKRDEQILIFSLRVEHCRRLVGELASAGISAGLMLGGKENRAELKDAVAGMRKKEMRVAVGTVQAVGTGVDLPSVGVGIVAMPVASNRQLFGQVAGRVCRAAGGVGAARLYCLADPCREKDWAAYFSDERPVFVRSGKGWIDARADKKKARKIAFPFESGIMGPYGGDAIWRTR